MILLRLFWEFFKVGLFSVGGGLATIPFLVDMGSRTGWFDSAEVSDMLAVSESTPGPIGVNMATYVGYDTAGVAGGIVATLGLIAPAIIIIMLIARVYKRFASHPAVESVFHGLRPAALGLIAAAGAGILYKTFIISGTSFLGSFNWLELALFAVLLAGLLVFKKHPVIYIAVAAAAGIIFKI